MGDSEHYETELPIPASNGAYYCIVSAQPSGSRSITIWDESLGNKNTLTCGESARIYLDFDNHGEHDRVRPIRESRSCM